MCHITCEDDLEPALQELATATAEPLRPRFSAKFFTGGASGAAAYMPQAMDADAGKVLSGRCVTLFDVRHLSSRDLSCRACITHAGHADLSREGIYAG